MQVNPAVFALVLTSAAVSQSEWFPAHVEPPTIGSVRLCDQSADGRVLAVSYRADSLTLETWEWNGARWNQRFPNHAPSRRNSFGLTYDSARRVAVLFGGEFAGAEFDDTWEWNGVDWVQRAPATRPSARKWMSLAFDSLRDRTLMYGGTVSGTTVGDCWEWDGSNWSPCAGAPSPGPRSRYSMAFDSARGVTVLFGGYDAVSSTPHNDVWEFDGSTWTNPQPSIAPPNIYQAAATYDAQSQSMVLYGGGMVPGGTNLELWSWDGTSWSQPASQTSPITSFDSGMAFDSRRGNVVLHGDHLGAETWTWDSASSTWTEEDLTPKFHLRAGVAFDWLDQTIIAGKNGTFRWDHANLRWTPESSTSHPDMVQLSSVLTFDPVRRQAVLYGTLALSSGPSETWIWDESTRDWQQRFPATSPPPLRDASMGYDPTTDRTVLFGGRDALGQLSDETWTWNGVNWVQAAPLTTPPARTDAVLEFDPSTGRLALIGGRDAGFDVSPGVWDWDGTDWSQRSILGTAIPPRHDPAAGRHSTGLLIAGGQAESGDILRDVWLLTGNSWTQLGTQLPFEFLRGTASVDLLTDELTVFDASGFAPGDSGVAAHIHGVWRFGPPRGATTPFGGGCSSSSTEPTLLSSGPPVLGDATFALGAAGLTPSQPAAFLFAAGLDLLTLPNACRLYVPAAFATVITQSAASGTATLPVALPAGSTLAGAEVFVQAASLDVASGGVRLTHGLRMRLGH